MGDEHLIALFVISLCSLKPSDHGARAKSMGPLALWLTLPSLRGSGAQTPGARTDLGGDHARKDEQRHVPGCGSEVPLFLERTGLRNHVLRVELRADSMEKEGLLLLWLQLYLLKHLERSRGKTTVDLLGDAFTEFFLKKEAYRPDGKEMSDYEGRFKALVWKIEKSPAAVGLAEVFFGGVWRGQWRDSGNGSGGRRRGAHARKQGPHRLRHARLDRGIPGETD